MIALMLATMGSATLWIMSYLHWPCGWRYEGTVGPYHCRVYHSSCPPQVPFVLPPTWQLDVQHPSGRWSTLRLCRGSASLDPAPRVIPPGDEFPPNVHLHLIGFGFTRHAEITGGRAFGAPVTFPVVRRLQYIIRLPLWAPVVLFGACPTIAFIRGPVRRWRRRRKGLCLACGYDLTGNVTGVCPECGVEIERR
jgi:hypothetical protein